MPGHSCRHQQVNPRSFVVIERVSAALDSLLDDLLGPIQVLALEEGDKLQERGLDQLRSDLSETDEHICRITVRLRTLKHSTAKVKGVLQSLQSRREHTLVSANQVVHRKNSRVSLPPEIISLICQFTLPTLVTTDRADSHLDNAWGLFQLRSKIWRIPTSASSSTYESKVWKSIHHSARLLVDFSEERGGQGIVPILPTVRQWWGLNLNVGGNQLHGHCRSLKEAVHPDTLPNLRSMDIHTNHTQCVVGSGLFRNVTYLRVMVDPRTYHMSLPQILGEVPNVRYLAVVFPRVPPNIESRAQRPQVELPHLRELKIQRVDFTEPRAFLKLIQDLPFRCDRIKSFHLILTDFTSGMQAESVERQTDAFLELTDNLNAQFPTLEHLRIGRGDLKLAFVAQLRIISHIANSSKKNAPLFPSLVSLHITVSHTTQLLSALQDLARSRFENPHASAVNSLFLSGNVAKPDVANWVDAIQPYFPNVTVYPFDKVPPGLDFYLS